MPKLATYKEAAIGFQPVKVRTGCQDRDGQLVFAGDELIAVVVRLDDPAHAEDQRGRWFLEAGFGPCAKAQPSAFPDLDAVADWMWTRLDTQ